MFIFKDVIGLPVMVTLILLIMKSLFHVRVMFKKQRNKSVIYDRPNKKMSSGSFDLN